MQIILLLAILGGLALLLVQNWSPVLPLVFLGLTTPALPLALWILISLAAGGGTSLAIASLFKLANYFTRPLPSKRHVKPSPRPQPSSNTSTNRPQNTSSNNSADDWLDDSVNDGDWNYEENKAESDDENNAGSYPQNSRSYEVNSQPKSSQRQGSVYSYSYREPENSEVGKTESVYDADYRVLTPPYKSPKPVQDGEDWGFDDELENEQEDLRSPRQ